MYRASKKYISPEMDMLKTWIRIIRVVRMRYRGRLAKGFIFWE